jgi:hypothetical protein
MTKIYISRALKYKNRIVERMHKLENDIRNGNAIIEGAVRDIDVRATLNERMKIEAHLVALKGLIDKANEPIKEMIVKMQELKGRIAFLTSIPSTHGIQDSRKTMFGEQGSVTYQAEIRKFELDNMVSEAQEEIDAIQEKVDQFNGANTIELILLPLKDVPNEPYSRPLIRQRTQLLD